MVLTTKAFFFLSFKTLQNTQIYYCFLTENSPGKLLLYISVKTIIIKKLGTHEVLPVFY